MSEINSIKPPVQGSVSSARPQTAEGRNPTAPADARVSNDKVSLTDAATQLQALQQQITAAPVVDSQRVAELKAAIENGQYTVDNQKLAQNVIAFEGQL